MRGRGRRSVAVALAGRRRPVLRAGMLGALALAGLLLLAAGGPPTAVSPSPEATPTTEPPTEDEPTAGPTISLEVPDLAISTYQGDELLGGTEVMLSQVVGQGKPVVLNFWAALCPPCRAEMPDIQRVFESRGHEVTIIGVDIGPQQLLGSRDQGRDLLTELEVTYPAGTTFDERVVRNFRIVGMPTTFFIFADGKLLRAWSGLLNEEKINEFIDELVAPAA